MSHLYLTESDVKVGYSEGQLTVRGPDGDERRLPFSCVDGISVYGKAQLSTQLIKQCMVAGVAVGYYSGDGHYLGRLTTPDHVDPDRQKRQVRLTDDDAFCLAWSRKVVEAKIRNSLALLDSLRDEYDFSKKETRALRHSLKNLGQATDVDMVVGFEGNAAKCYFQCLSAVLADGDFAFKGRSTRPPKDPFNSMISYGYSLLHRNIIGAIEHHGLHPYFAFMHKTKRGHAALASDLIEELRAPIVDRAVLGLIRAGEIDPNAFRRDDDGATYMEKETMRTLTNRLSDVIVERRSYFAPYGDRRAYGFQVMLDKKIDSAVEAIERCDVELYKPLLWEPDSR